jgi:hypothetical protein
MRESKINFNFVSLRNINHVFHQDILEDRGEQFLFFLI